MNISDLLNPLPPSKAPPTSEGPESRQLTLPRCVLEPRDFSKKFPCVSPGFIRLPPPRRLVSLQKQVFLRPRAEHLFGSNKPGLCRLTVCCDADGYIRVFCAAKWAPQPRVDNDCKASKEVKYPPCRFQRLSEQKQYKAAFFTVERTNGVDVGGVLGLYADMSIDPRAIRSEEEERRVKAYHAALSMLMRTSPLTREAVTSRPASCTTDLAYNSEKDERVRAWLNHVPRYTSLRPADWSSY